MQVSSASNESSNRPYQRCIPVVLAAAAAVPKLEEIQEVLAASQAAVRRGYYLPDEDEQLREIYTRYLAMRSSLLTCVQAISGRRLSFKATGGLAPFAVAFAAACVLVRSANFIVELAADNPVARQKLDEPEPRYGLPGKTFTEIYKSLTSPVRWWRFFEAVRYFRQNRAAMLELKADPEMAPVIEQILAEEPLIQTWEADFLQRRLRYRLYSLLRRHRSGYRKTMFHLFRMSGSAIAEMKQPFVKAPGVGKRVGPEVRARLETFLRPGDVLICRHDDAVSNLFLPGFWPHAAYYIGSPEQRRALGLPETPEAAMETTIRFVEAKKDGVKLRPADDTLAIDAFTVLRPTLPGEFTAQAIRRALGHAGKLYDFIFDFRVSDRLACTELVYRAYHGIGGVAFELRSHAGRHCLSAEDLINQAIGGGWFEPVLVFGLRGDQAWIEGSEAREVLRTSFRSEF